MDLDQIKRNVDLVEYAKSHFGYKCDSKGRGSCLLHPPDSHNSFSIWKGKNGVWHFKCFHEGTSGTIIDLKSHLENIDEKQSIRLLREEFAELKKPSKVELEIEREHVYRDAEGKPVFKKVKYEPNSKKIRWGFMHYENTKWLPGKGAHDLIPYNLDKFKDKDSVIICEGEKDAETISGLGIDLFATSAPVGCSTWPDSITKYFSGFKESTFLYDVGNDEHAKKHAAKLHAAFPEMKIYIARVPMEEREKDITDYLDMQADKAMALLDVMNRKEEICRVADPGKGPDAAPQSQAEKVRPNAPEIENEFLNHYVKFISEVTDAPRIFVLFSGIALLSGILNKFYFHFPRQTHLNLYLLLLAPSTYYRKSTCTDMVSDYLRAVNPGLVLPDSFTAEALFEILKKWPRGLIIWRELIQIKEFQFGSDYNRGLPSFLVDIYDYKEQFKRWTKGEGEIIIENPIVSILSAGIAGWFVENLDKRDFEGGIWTRFLFIPAPEEERRYALPQKFILNPVIERKLKELDAKEPAEMKLENILPLLQEWGERHMEQVQKLDTGILQAIFQRLEVMLLKLACLFQLAEDGSAEVQEPAFRDAVRVIEYIKGQLPTFFKEEIHFTKFDRAKARVLKFIRQKSPRLKSDIVKFTNTQTDWVEKILQQLREEGQVGEVRVDPGQKGGRPGKSYRFLGES